MTKAAEPTDPRRETRDSKRFPPGGGELHLTIAALKINGLLGIDDTINIDGTNLTLTQGVLTNSG
jgi:hypothetical protein